MRRWLPGVVIGGLGVMFIGVTLAARLFTVAPAFDRMTGDFRPQMQSAELAQLHQDLAGLTAVQAEFTTKVTPQLATALHMTPTQFAVTMQQQFPAVFNGMQAVPQISGQFATVLGVLGNEQSRFNQADAIPTKSVPPTSMPWVFVGAGLLALGVAMLVARRRGPWLAVALGSLLVVTPLVLSLPSKASAADTMNSHLRPVYTAQLLSGAKQSMTTMQAMGTEMETKMLPALAQMLHMQPEQLQSYLVGTFPATAAGVAALPASLARFNALVGAFDHGFKDYNTIKSTSLAPIVWSLLAAGGLILLIGEWGLAERRPVVSPARHIRIRRHASSAL